MDAAAVCTSDESCSDGLFCNGIERCAPAAASSDGRGCVVSASPCPAALPCDEAADLCTGADCETPDSDGDGHDALACGGDDCDDEDADRFPGNLEVCDEEGHDEDCDPTSFGRRDEDADGYVDARCCDASSGEVRCGRDCDDRAPHRFPGLIEACDGKDNDCDRMVDEGLELTFYRDADGDGFGRSDDSRGGVCTPPEGYVALSNDCDDTLPGRNPGAPEVCDTVDNDCDGVVDEAVGSTYYRDADGDNFGDSDTAIVSCSAPAGFVANGSDCDDGSAARNPGNSEQCDAVADNDCNPDTNPYDGDGDGLDAAGCGGPDCNDGEATVFPGAPELCDGLDNRCVSGGGRRTAEDGDLDGYVDSEAGCSGGPLMAGDCDDTRPEASPGGVEICDGADNDCDRHVDENPAAEDSCNRVGTVGACISGNCSIEACSAPYANCDGVASNGCEANLQSDEASCGGCLNACPLDATCEGGACHCPADAQTVCSGGCVDLLTHPAHCGACGNGCPTGATCESGTCRCEAGFEACGSLCVDLLTDTAHCGACGAGCFGGSCEGGTCSCPGTDPALCAGTCRDLASDNLNCGACGQTCIGGSCAGGVCSCAEGEDLCDGVCIDTSSDALHCGACDARCIVGSSCVTGRCSPSLDFARAIGSSSFERVGGVAVDGDANGVYVISYTGPVDLGSGLIAPDGSDVTAVAYRPDGTYVWHSVLESGPSMRAGAITALTSGDVVAAYRPADNGGSAGTLVSLSPTGAERWRTSFAATGGRTYNFYRWSGQRLASTPDGDVVVAFTFVGTASPGGLGPFEASTQDILMVGLSGTDGTVLWAWQLGATYGQPFPTALDVDSTGRIYLAGVFDDVHDFGSGSVFPQGAADGFLLAMEPDRTTRWARIASGPREVAIEDVVLVDDEPVLFASFAEREVRIDGYRIESSTGQHTAAARFDASGALRWASRVDTHSDGHVTGATLHDGRILAAGTAWADVRTNGHVHLWIDPSDGAIERYAVPFPEVYTWGAALASSPTGVFAAFMLWEGTVPLVPGDGSHSHRGYGDGALYFLGD